MKIKRFGRMQISLILCVLAVIPLNAEPLREVSEKLPEGENAEPRDDNYQLVWSDEFEKNGTPDSTYWEFEKGFQRNDELQWYQSSNARCEDGVLVIEGRRERVKNPHFRVDGSDWKTSREFADYTSSSLITKPKLAWKYGRFEIRARIPINKGAWPAIWTTGHGRWPDSGEIDIMEYYQGLILANFVHADDNGGDKWNESKHSLEDIGEDDWDSKFHIWTMEWTEQVIRIYLDGKILNTLDVSNAFNGNTPTRNPYREPHRLRLNLAVGSNGGDPAGDEFPIRYEIDYVRIYQEKGK